MEIIRFKGHKINIFKATSQNFHQESAIQCVVDSMVIIVKNVQTVLKAVDKKTRRVLSFLIVLIYIR